MQTYLALGDSYTIGESVAETERFPVQLAAQLRTRGFLVSAPTIVATTGWTTDELAAGIAAASLAPPYDLVSLLIGVNNQFRGYPLETYRVDFRQLLEQAVHLAGNMVERVLVFSIPDWGITPFAGKHDRDAKQVANEIDAFNSAKRTITEEIGAHYFDITPISRQAAQAPELIAADGLHPSGKMYGLWVKTCFEHISFIQILK